MYCNSQNVFIHREKADPVHFLEADICRAEILQWHGIPTHHEVPVIYVTVRWYHLAFLSKTALHRSGVVLPVLPEARVWPSILAAEFTAWLGWGEFYKIPMEGNPHSPFFGCPYVYKDTSLHGLVGHCTKTVTRR